VRRIRHLRLRDASIQRKLTVIIMLTSSVALLLACGAFVTYDLITFRGELVRELSTLAEIIGTNSTAALAFNDKHSAEETLFKPRITVSVSSVTGFMRAPDV
jgi:hypothetical protein